MTTSQILFSFIATITVFAPYPDTWGNQSAYETVLQITPIVSAVSVTAYYFGDWLNSAVLSFMKARMHKAGFGARAIMSTVVGQVLDTLVFYLCLWPFHIWDNMPLSGYLLIGLTDYAVKVGQEVVFLPLTKKVVAFWKRYDGMDEYDTGEMRTYNPFRV